MSGIIERWIDALETRSLRRLEDRIEDAEYEQRRWGFAHTPSESRRLRVLIERLSNRRDRLLAERQRRRDR